MLTRLLLIAISIIIFTSPVFAQGEFLESGQNGFGFGLSYANVKESSNSGVSRSDDDSNFGLSMGYSLNGRFDLNIAYSLATDPVLSLGANLFILKQDVSKIPFSLCTEIGVITGSGTENIGYIAPGIMFRFSSDKKNYYLPFISINITNFASSRESNSFTTAGIAWSYAAKKIVFFIAPAASFGDLGNSFGVSVGIIFKELRKKRVQPLFGLVG